MKLILALVSFLLIYSSPDDKNIPANLASQVRVSGSMRATFRDGQLLATIAIDTIKNKNHLYGLGPLENLTGEILVADGKSYKATVTAPNKMKVEETYQIKAPFFVYANVAEWREVFLPDSIRSIPQLEAFLVRESDSGKQPFAFKLEGTVEKATAHVVNLSPGTPVHSPQDVFNNQFEFELNNAPVELIGFFSTNHRSIFTHHDSFVHIHLITDDKSKMGHLDQVILKPGAVKLFLPAE